MSSRAPRRAVPRLVLAAVAALVLAPVLAGCGVLPPAASETTGVVGEGDVQTDVRDLPPFSRISVGAPGSKVIVGAATAQKVSVAAQPNLLPLIKTDVVDGQLIVTLMPRAVSRPASRCR